MKRGPNSGYSVKNAANARRETTARIPEVAKRKEQLPMVGVRCAQLADRAFIQAQTD